MSRKLFRKLIPDKKKFAENKYLRLFGPVILEPQLWHLHRKNVAKAFSIGLFCAFLPIPFQMLVAAFLAIYLRANLPISVALVWVSNPLTIPPLFYFAYKLGSWILQMPVKEFHFVLSWDWLMSQIGIIWMPLLLGSLICGVVLAVLGNIAVRVIWRVSVMFYLARKRNKTNR